MNSISLAELAEYVDGTLHGDGGVAITGAATLSTARSGDVTLADGRQVASQLARTQASAVVVPADFQPAGIPYISVDDVRGAFSRIVTRFRPQRQARRVGISPDARIGGSARLAEGVDIYPYAVIGEDVEIGAGSTIHSGVTIMDGCRVGEQVTIFPGAVFYEDTVIGPRVIVHAKAVLGAYGFGYETVDGRHCRGAQLGFVKIEADVEIGAGTTIDRGTYGPTVVGEGTKIDNLVMIAHNCRIGRHNIICSQVGIAGSSTTGDYVVMAGQVGVPDHIRVGDRAILGAKAGIMRDVPDDTAVIGIPATPERDQMVKQAAFARLPEMRKQLQRLQRIVDQLVVTHAADQDAA